jgi:hypothetical protein
MTAAYLDHDGYASQHLGKIQDTLENIEALLEKLVKIAEDR